MSKQLHDFTLVFIKKLPASILCKELPDSDETILLPLSQVEYVEAKRPGYVEVTMPEWLALEKGLI